MTTNTIHHEQVAALQGATEPVHTRWSYRDDEPFAVTVAFCTERGQWIEWVFARDLLIDGMDAPAGFGDVQVRPDHEDQDLLILEISSPSGNAVFELGRDATEEFLHTTLELVPSGTESAYFDVDRLIEEISGV